MPCICYPIQHLIIQATVKSSGGEDSLCAVGTLRSVRLFFTSSSPIANKNRGFPSLLNIKKPFYHKCRRMSISNSSPSHTDSNEDAGSSPIPFDYAEIVVIRHGETTWNSSGRIQGHLDAELNEVGRQQATAVADRLSKESKVSAVYSSDLKRALETAQIIAKSCNLNEVIQDPALRERHLGDLQGLVFRDAARLNPEAYRAFSSPKTNKEIPGGGESFDQLYQRTTSSLERIARKHKGERVVVVTHGGAVRALFKRAAPKGLSQGKGQLDPELNEVGRQQATAVADRLSKESKVSAVYSSDLKRALETAQIIVKSCNLNEVIQEPALRERHMGDLHGLVFRDAARLNPEAYRAFSSPKTNQEIPGGGESFDQLYQRMTSSLERIARKHKGERVVVVTHGGALEALLKRASPKGLYQGKVMNTSVNIFHLSDSDDWIITVLGDVSHLSKTGFLESGFGGDKNSG